MKNVLKELIMKLKVDEAMAYAQELYASHTDPAEVHEMVMEGLTEVGRRYATGEYYIADLIVAGMLTQEIINLTHLTEIGQTPVVARGHMKVVFGTIFDDIHDIGKNIMIDVIRQRGFEVIDLGIDVEVMRFVEAVVEEKPNYLCISCVMSGSMVYIKELLRTLNAKNLMGQMQILIGGAAAPSADPSFAQYENVVFISNDFYDAIQFFEKQAKKSIDSES